MLLYPTVPQMLENVENRYLLVNVVARRARQITIEAEEFKLPLEKPAISQAVDEVANGELKAKLKNKYFTGGTKT